MSQFWSSLTKTIEPYVPGEQPQDKSYIKLNTNENPYPPSPHVLQAMKEAVNEKLKLYPDPTCDELKHQLARYYHVKPSQVFVGNGSDEVLALSFAAFFERGKTLLFPDITYSFYKVYADFYQLDYELIPLNDDFTINEQSLYESPGGVIFPNPNAPTSIYTPLEVIERILQKNKEEVVIVDEAYIDFGGESAITLIDSNPNLLVTQTLSKSRSLAGLRVGFAIGHEDLIDGLERIKNSFNSYTLDRIALQGAIASLDDEQYFQSTTEKIIATREITHTKLVDLGFTVLPSKTNFLFISHPKVEAEVIFQKLREKGILVRHFQKPKISKYLRVTVGSNEEMEMFVSSLEDILN